LLSESGRLEFEEFITLAAKFIIEEDAEAMEKELREAFRLYDKEGNFTDFCGHDCLTLGSLLIKMMAQNITYSL
jgi:hypothetical protein